MKPHVFVGSAAEDLDIAYAVQENLERDANVEVWTQGIFGLSQLTMESLEGALGKADFAIFVLTPHDIVRLREKEQRQARDNVVFELGLFIGRIGRERTYWVIPHDVTNFHLPTDLIGMTPGQYNSDHKDNLTAALGAVCNKIRNRMRELGNHDPAVANDRSAGISFHSDGRVPLHDTVRLLKSAESSVVVIGSTLRSWIGYFDRAPKSEFKHPILHLMKQGVSFRFYLLDPDSDSAKVYAEDRRAEAIEETRKSVQDLHALSIEFKDLAGTLEVFAYSRFPFGYGLFIDNDSLRASALISHYLPGVSRADCPYLEITREANVPLFEKYVQALNALTTPDRCIRLFGSNDIL